MMHGAAAAAAAVHAAGGGLGSQHHHQLGSSLSSGASGHNTVTGSNSHLGGVDRKRAFHFSCIQLATSVFRSYLFCSFFYHDPLAA
jgi:hypothetical protein